MHELSPDQRLALRTAVMDRCYHKGVPKDDREDVLSVALLKAAKGHKFQPDKGSLKTWAATHAMRACGDYFRDRRGKKLDAPLEELEGVNREAQVSFKRWQWGRTDQPGKKVFVTPLLTNQQIKVLHAYRDTDSADEAAALLGYKNRRMVEDHLFHIRKRLGVHSSHRALIMAARLRLVQL